MQNIYLGILFPLIFNHSDGFKQDIINTSLDNNGCHTSDCLVEMSVKNNYSLESRSNKSFRKSMFINLQYQVAKYLFLSQDTLMDVALMKAT